MVGFSKKKKSSKMRRFRTHGRGKKGGRGAGLRGGRGNAGAHKHKRVLYFSKMTDGTYWGRPKGFHRPEEVLNVATPINVGEIDEQVDAWVAAGKATKQGDAYTVDLAVLGYDKLLGAGQVRRKLALTVAAATDSAKGKVEAAGGSVAVAEAA